VGDNPVLDAVFHSWRFHVIATACRLGVFSRIEENGMDSERLARDTQCVPRLLEALLDACVATGLLHREGRRYVNSHLSSAYLVEGRPLYLGHILEVQARGTARWDRLLEFVRTGEALSVPGEVGEHDQLFTMAMNDLGANGEAEALAGAVNLSSCRTLLDVGCGSGLYAIALCRRFPRLAATLIDREEVLRTTASLVAASGLADRIGMRAGDMTACEFGDDVDAVLLSDSLYHDPDAASRILRAAHAALSPAGIAILRGYYPDPGASESPFGAVFRLNLLLFDPDRRPPTAEEISGLLAGAGFRDIRRFALTERSTCFLGTK
jgi:SAM-dependent methyltransferase